MTDINALFDFADEMEILQRLPRAGYVMSGVTEPQTVGSHIFGVSLWCLMLIEKMNEDVDKEKVLTMAVLHEMAETRISDIPAPARRYMQENAVSDAEKAAVEDITKELPASWREIWNEFEDAETIEARIVKAADKLELMHKILMYERYGNGSFTRFWTWDKNFPWHGINEAKEIFNEMKRRHNENC